MQWFRLYDDLLDDPRVQRLSARDFKGLFFAALTRDVDEDNPFAEYIEGPYGSKDSNRPAITEWRVIRHRIFDRDDYTCTYCGERGGRLECDHVIPVCRGGTHDDDNLVTACFKCNRSKRAKLVEEWTR